MRLQTLSHEWSERIRILQIFWMGQDVFIDRDLVIMMNKLVVLLTKRHENKGKAFGGDMDIVESFHHFSTRLHKLG